MKISLSDYNLLELHILNTSLHALVMTLSWIHLEHKLLQ